MFKDMKWFNQPPQWKVDQNSLHVTTGEKTDYWRETFYGFVHDDGHFFYQEVKGDFTAEVLLVGEFDTLYDQSGLMVRKDEKNWLKTGIEYTDGIVHLSAVLTRNFSDWSVTRLPDYKGQIKLRLTRYDSAILVQYLDENNTWQLLRLGYLDLADSCQIGVMCCSPSRAGFKTEFRDFMIKAPISKEELHV